MYSFGDGQSRVVTPRKSYDFPRCGHPTASPRIPGRWRAQEVRCGRRCRSTIAELKSSSGGAGSTTTHRYRDWGGIVRIPASGGPPVESRRSIRPAARRFTPLHRRSLMAVTSCTCAGRENPTSASMWSHSTRHPRIKRDKIDGVDVQRGLRRPMRARGTVTCSTSGWHVDGAAI